MGMLLITALIAVLVSASRDKNYIRSLEEDNYTKDVIIKDLERRVK